MTTEMAADLVLDDEDSNRNFQKNAAGMPAPATDDEKGANSMMELQKSSTSANVGLALYDRYEEDVDLRL